MRAVNVFVALSVIHGWAVKYLINCLFVGVFMLFAPTVIKNVLITACLSFHAFQYGYGLRCKWYD